MKKKYIGTFLFYLLLSTTVISSTKKITATHTQEEQAHTNENLPYEENEMEDDLDHLIEDAIEVGLVKTEIVPPSTTEVILTRAAIILILKPYLYIMAQYDNIKDWLVARMKQLGYYKEEEKTEQETESITSE